MSSLSEEKRRQRRLFRSRSSCCRLRRLGWWWLRMRPSMKYHWMTIVFYRKSTTAMPPLMLVNHHARLVGLPRHIHQSSCIDRKSTSRPAQPSQLWLQKSCLGSICIQESINIFIYTTHVIGSSLTCRDDQYLIFYFVDHMARCRKRTFHDYFYFISICSHTKREWWTLDEQDY